jgi:hypothetical protein
MLEKTSCLTETCEWSEKAYAEFCESCPNQMSGDLVQASSTRIEHNFGHDT